MVLLGEEAQVEDCFSPFRDSGNIDARWCMVCAERTISSKIILDAPDVCHVESHFFSFGDSVSVSAR